MEEYTKAILPIKDISKPNEEIEIYRGVFFLENNKTSVKIDGHIAYRWFPKREVYFTGTPKNNIDIEEKYTIRTPKDEFTNIEVFMTFSEALVGHGILKIEGIILKDIIFGDTKLIFNKINFVIANMREFYGEKIEYNSKTKNTRYKGRIELKSESYTIIIDKHPDFKNRKNDLVKIGGYHILYIGEINFNKKQRLKNINLEAIKDQISYFIRFLNKKPCEISLMTAIDNKGNELWTDYTSGRTSLGYITNEIIIDNQETIEFNQAWQIFCDLWETDKDVIKFLIDWYNEANQGTLEVSIIHIQIAFELFFNWYIIEKKKIIEGDSINAENKIRLLLHEFDIALDIPDDYINLKNYITTLKLYKNPIKLFVEIRNKMIHANDAQIKEHQKMPIDVLIEIRTLAFSYLHQALCKLFGFKEHLP
ncbi:MAG: hypothetical protein MUC49_11340 [Raineya sp.]|jgi:hypothetical protein|nr:hypothetical protein [Raineya sp.]